MQTTLLVNRQAAVTCRLWSRLHRWSDVVVCTVLSLAIECCVTGGETRNVDDTVIYLIEACENCDMCVAAKKLPLAECMQIRVSTLCSSTHFLRWRFAITQSRCNLEKYIFYTFSLAIMFRGVTWQVKVSRFFVAFANKNCVICA